MFFGQERTGVAMSDNRRVYRTIRTGLRQLCRTEPKGNFARHLNTLAALVTGIVQAKNCQLPAIARHAPEAAKAESRIKRYSRWIQNERIEFEAYYLPFVEQVLVSLADLRPLAFVVDGSEVGHNCIALMVNLIYQKRALPVTWLVVKGCKGHLPEDLHIALIEQLRAVVPPESQVIFLGDGEFDGVELQSAAEILGWSYVCRTAKNIQLYEAGIPFSFSDLCLQPGAFVSLENIQFTRQAYGSVTVIAWWQKEYAEPIFLVTNFELAAEACYWYKKRFQIETFFSDEKSRGFYLHKSHLANPARLAKLLLAACLAYLWIVFLGVLAHRENMVKIIHRTERCDWSLFRLGLCFLEYLLNEEKPIPVAFNPLAANYVR
jgi:hypothetical protein